MKAFDLSGFTPTAQQDGHEDARGGPQSRDDRLSVGREDPLTGLSAELLDEVVRVFGERARGRRWLVERLPALDGACPAEIAMRPGGEEKVRELLLRIEHGIFS